MGLAEAVTRVLSIMPRSLETVGLVYRVEPCCQTSQTTSYNAAATAVSEGNILQKCDWSRLLSPVNLMFNDKRLKCSQDPRL